MGQRYLIDTNIVIDFTQNILPAAGRLVVATAIDDDPCLSVINKIELLSLSIVPRAIEELVDTVNIIDISEAIVNRTIAIRKMRKIKLPDAIIAATAIEHKLHLITRNVKDFDNIKGLKVVDPWHG